MSKLAKLAWLAGGSCIAGMGLNSRYHTDTPNAENRARTDAVKADIAKQGFTDGTFERHVEFEKLLHAYHVRADKSQGLVDKLKSEKISSVSVRGISLFDRVTAQSIRDEESLSLSVRFKRA